MFNRQEILFRRMRELARMSFEYPTTYDINNHIAQHVIDNPMTKAELRAYMLSLEELKDIPEDVKIRTAQGLSVLNTMRMRIVNNNPVIPPEVFPERVYGAETLRHFSKPGNLDPENPEHTELKKYIPKGRGDIVPFDEDTRTGELLTPCPHGISCKVGSELCTTTCTHCEVLDPDLLMIRCKGGEKCVKTF